MSDIRSYMKYKQQKEKQEKVEKIKTVQKDYKTKIWEHRMRYFFAVLFVILILVAAGVFLHIQIKNRTYTDYEVKSSISREMINGTTVLNLEGTILTYSKDGVNCADTKGTVLWNQTFEMQNPIVAVQGKTAAIADYNGRNIYVMNNESFLGQISTNLPVRNIAVSANGVVAAVLDDSAVTRIYLYDSQGTELGSFTTRMKNSGYPVSVSLSENGQLVLISFLYVDSGEIKSKIAFYNFGQVGKNKSDNFVSGYDYTDSVVPFTGFMNSSIAFAVADGRIMFYSGSQIPTSAAEQLFDEEVQGVYYNSSYVGLVYLNTDSENRYRMDVYNTSGSKILSKEFNMEYTDIIFCEDYFVAYNELECMVCNMKGVEKFNGNFKNTVYAVIPTKNVARYVLVTQNSLETIELK
ncbi:MAG: hypothetical protein IJN54_15865 [Lachnospiraceae bacterium]|nr:hypothetical protein [Lachnospiraceae bacterium]